MRLEKAQYTRRQVEALVAEACERAVRQDREFIAQIIRALPTIKNSSRKQHIIERYSGYHLRAGLRRVLDPFEFPVWKTIKLGTGLITADDFRAALTKKKVSICGASNTALELIRGSSNEREVDLTLISVLDVLNGFEKEITLRTFYRSAINAGLELCPAEVGPQLRIQCNLWSGRDREEPFEPLIAMEPIDLPGWSTPPMVFHMVEGNDERGPWLHGACADMGAPMDHTTGTLENTLYVFVLPRNRS